jgi:hypothetical protein
MAIDQIQRLMQQIVARFIVEHLRRHSTSERVGGIWQVGKSRHCSKRQIVCESSTRNVMQLVFRGAGLMTGWGESERSKICPPSLGFKLLKRSKRASVVKFPKIREYICGIAAIFDTTSESTIDSTGQQDL